MLRVLLVLLTALVLASGPTVERKPADSKGSPQSIHSEFGEGIPPKYCPRGAD